MAVRLRRPAYSRTRRNDRTLIMAIILHLPTKSPERLGFERARRGKRLDAKQRDQLGLFEQPSSAQIHQLRGSLTPFDEALMLDEQGDPRAAEAYRNAIGHADCVADAYCNLGILEYQGGKAGRAVDCFTESLKHDPRHFESHYNLGNLYFESGDVRLAKVHYEIAAELAPTFPNVYFNLGLVHAMNEEHAQAIESLTKYKELSLPEEGKKTDELLASLRRIMAARK
jgi:tetratricopeptide (TPR) repeat protein